MYYISIDGFRWLYASRSLHGAKCIATRSYCSGVFHLTTCFVGRKNFAGIVEYKAIRENKKWRNL